MSKTTHVVHNPNGGWKVLQGGAERASGIFDTQRQAIDRARDLSIRQETELVIHGRDGKIRECDSHGQDPCPPKDKD